MRIGELFAGIGGASLAVSMVIPDAETVWQADLVNEAVRRRHFPDDAQTVALSRLCEFWRGRGRAAYEQRVGEGVFDRAFDIFARLNDLDFPLILNRERESAESWRRARDYFTRLNRSVPFTAAELADFDAFVDQQETTP